MVDVTTVFRLCIETVRKRDKELEFLKPSPSENASGAKSKIFPGKRSEYTARARDLSKTITSLRDFLYDNRTAYLNIRPTPNLKVHGSGDGNKDSALSTGGIKTMDDAERDQIDCDVQKIIQNCQKRIFEYETLIETAEPIRNDSFLTTHVENVAKSLTEYLKEVTAVYSEIRAVRVKRTIDYQHMSRLSSVPSLRINNNSSSKSSGVGTSSSTYEKNLKSGANGMPSNRSTASTGGETAVDERQVPAYFQDDDEIGPEELQMLEEENAALLNELHSLAEEVDQIQSSVVQIAQLQEIFTEKVLQQEKDVEKISNVVIGTTENIKGGNEQIRQAIQKNADFRAWVLFFILVMAFSLLFLDWYND